MRRPFPAAQVVALSMALSGCGHVHPIEGVETAAVALDVYVDSAAERLASTAEAGIDLCNQRSSSQEEYFDCIAPLDATLANAEKALRQLVQAQATGYEALQAARDFEAALEAASP